MTRRELKLLKKSDLRMILNWRNSLDVRSYMFSSKEICYEDHQKWFDHLKLVDDQRWFVFYENNIALGVVSFTNIDFFGKKANWGFYTKPDSPKGTGTRLGITALEYFFEELGFHKLNGEVLGSNTRSLRMHEKLGFQIEGHFKKHHYNGEEYVDVIRLGVLKNEWLSKWVFCTKKYL